MILGDSKPNDGPTDSQTTLDDIFRRAAARRPHAIALTDPPNRADFACGAPQRFTFAEADRIIDGIASRLHRLGLQPDTVIGIFLPNTVEAVLTILGVLRAGMIAAPLPLLWRRADLKEALGRIGAKVIITASRIGDLDACDLAAMKVAAELFPIRYVCAFGSGRPDGVIPLDDLMMAGGADDLPVIERGGDAALHVALVTWDVTPEGPGRRGAQPRRTDCRRARHAGGKRHRALRGHSRSLRRQFVRRLRPHHHAGGCSPAGPCACITASMPRPSPRRAATNAATPLSCRGQPCRDSRLPAYLRNPIYGTCSQSGARPSV